MSRGLFFLLLIAAACKGPPAQLVVGFGATVVVHNMPPIQLSAQVLDAAGHLLPSSGVNFEWSQSCSAWHGASLIVYHPRDVDRRREWSGTVTVAY